MRILLDTHCWLWMLTKPERFSPAALALVEDGQQELYLSAASSWEIAIKHSLGKLALPEPPAEYLPRCMITTGVRGLPVEHRHAFAVAGLPTHHRDPFDRILVAQAIVEVLPILTADPAFSGYGVETIAAS